MEKLFIHPTAEVVPTVEIGTGTKIWHYVQVRERAKIGKYCILGKSVYVDFDVVIGDKVKIQNGCSLYHGSQIEDGVFLGPGVILTNDKYPRAINRDGTLKTDVNWQAGKILVKRGASLGAKVVVLPDITIGKFAMVGAGSVVTKDIPDHGLVVGNPAKLVGFVCYCGAKLVDGQKKVKRINFVCLKCQSKVSIPMKIWKTIHDTHS